MSCPRPTFLLGILGPSLVCGIGDATGPAALAHGYNIALRWGAVLLGAGAIVATCILPRRTSAPDDATVPAAVSN